jgi:hypothetical protein
MLLPAFRAPRLRTTLALTLTVALAASAIPGCAHNNVRPALKLQALADKLTGTYDNSAQVASDLARGVASPHLAVRLSVAPAHALVISDTAYYVRESVLADPRRVLSQRIWKLTADPKKQRVVQSLFVFKDPMRWIGAADDPQLLISLTPDDLEPLPGCDLAWTLTDGLLRAVAVSDSCRPEALKEGMLLEQRLAIDGDELALGEAQVGADGKVAAAALFDSDVDFYRFQRRASAPHAEAGSTPSHSIP